jgi:hypothetical protein
MQSEPLKACFKLAQIEAQIDMLNLEALRVVRSLGWQFWLPLPLLSLLLWFGTGFVGDRILSRVRTSPKFLTADTSAARQLSETITAIIADIDPIQQRSRVQVKTSNSLLQILIFEFTLTQPTQLEAAISRELGIPSDRVRQLIQYQSSIP